MFLPGQGDVPQSTEALSVPFPMHGLPPCAGAGSVQLRSTDISSRNCTTFSIFIFIFIFYRLPVIFDCMIPVIIYDSISYICRNLKERKLFCPAITSKKHYIVTIKSNFHIQTSLHLLKKCPYAYNKCSCRKTV
jgi:hypothetical protein